MRSGAKEERALDCDSRLRFAKEAKARESLLGMTGLVFVWRK
jgi:hypothetical protein